jgi:preprotein translocase subunit SecG
MLAYVPAFSSITGLSGSMVFTFLLVVHAIIAALLVAVILAQRSEGGGLTGGGSPAGLMSARGASDFLTRSTAILATVFVLMSIVLAVMAATRHAVVVDTSLNRAAPVAPAAPGSQPLPGTATFGADANTAAALNGNSARPGGLTTEENKASPKGK